MPCGSNAGSSVSRSQAPAVHPSLLVDHRTVLRSAITGRAGVGLEHGAQGGERPVEPARDRAHADIERLGHVGERQVEQVAQGDDRAVVDREAPEAALELVSVEDREELVGGQWLTPGRHVAVVQ